MDSGKSAGERSAAKNPTTVERTEREVIVTRTFDAPARLVFEAWSRPELFRQWWLPKSMGMTLVACEMQVCTGGHYRLTIGHAGGQMEFFGRYIEVVPDSRIVWTNEEGGQSGPVTTVTFEERDGRTLLVMRELYPSKEACDAGAGAAEATTETFAQLDEVLAA